MKSYFQKHCKPRAVTEPDNADLPMIAPVPDHADTSGQFTWAKPNRTSSFFKSKHVAKILTLRKLGNYNKPNDSLNLKPNPPIPEVNQLQRLQSLRQRDESLSSQNVRERGFSLQYLKMTKKHKVKSLLEKKILKNPVNVQKKAWLDSPFDNIQLPISQKYIHNAQMQTRKALTPLSGNLSKEQGAQQYQTQYTHSKSGDHLGVFKSRAKKTNTFFKKFPMAQEILSSNLPRSPSFEQRTTPISFIPIENIRLQSTRYAGFVQGNKQKSQRQTSNKTFMKKSKYSPFKSRNGSSASNNEGLSLAKINTKGFSIENLYLRQLSQGDKQSNNFQINKHKRFKSQANILIQSQENNHISPSKQMSETITIINNSNSVKIIAQGLYGNIKLLNEIKDCLQVAITSIKQQKIHLTKISQLIKIYVFGEKEVPQKKYPNHLFPQMDQLFQKDEHKCIIKQTICAERLLVICIVDLIGQYKLIQLLQEVKLTLMVLLVIYLKILKLAENSKIRLNLTSEQNSQITALLSNKKLKSKHSIQTNLKAQLLPYVNNLYRHSRQMYENIMKQQIDDSKTRTINRTFYQILKKYAIYLTRNQQATLKKYPHEMISNFATCPAPYILSKPQKKYTLCIDLDETLLFSNFSCAKRFETIYRPGAKEFIIQLSKYFEIVVFTSSVKEYADAVIKPFVQFVDHALYRYHVTRGTNLSNTVKDLSRIGRKLERVIFVDDLECNTKLQPQNSIRVTPWKGDPKDKQMIVLKRLLLSVGKEEHEDLRKAICQVRQALINDKKSQRKSPQPK